MALGAVYSAVAILVPGLRMPWKGRPGKAGALSQAGFTLMLGGTSTVFAINLAHRPEPVLYPAVVIAVGFALMLAGYSRDNRD
jgi:hypothetical protein